MRVKLLSLVLIIGMLLTGCGESSSSSASTPNTGAFKEPTVDISRDVVKQVAKNGSVRYNIQVASINNPEFMNYSKSSTIHTNVSLLVIRDNDADILNVNLKSPLESGDKSTQKDILIFLPSVANIHYMGAGDDFIVIKDSPYKYYVEGQSDKLHSYVADIYINKERNLAKFGANTYNMGKGGTEVIDSQPIK